MGNTGMNLGQLLTKPKLAKDFSIGTSENPRGRQVCQEIYTKLIRNTTRPKSPIKPYKRSMMSARGTIIPRI